MSTILSYSSLLDKLQQGPIIIAVQTLVNYFVRPLKVYIKRNKTCERVKNGQQAKQDKTVIEELHGSTREREKAV